MKHSLLLFVCVSFLLLTTACSKKPAVVPPQVPTSPISIEDEKTFPQDPLYYAKKIGQTKALLSKEDQLRSNERFNSVFFGSWEMSHGVTKAGEACIHRARGYKLGGEKWSQSEWDVLVRNADMQNFPSRAQPAIIVKNTDLREMPSHEPRYDKPIETAKAYPFDDFQYSLLPTGLPVFLTHFSADGRWCFVETPLASGWVVSQDVAFVDEAFRETWKSYPQGAVVQDNAPVSGIVTPLKIGTVLPLVQTRGKKADILVPVREKNGFAKIKKLQVSTSVIKEKPLLLTPQAMAAIMKQMYGERYGWGSMYGLRDCSSTTHDLLVPFGIWLPRNSRPQARTGRVISLEGMSHEEKERTILEYGTPFLSLVGLPGHITMYVGNHNGRVAILHNVWGVRTIDGEDDNARHIIGKTVITSLTPGSELPNLYRKRSFIDRVRALATPGLN